MRKRTWIKYKALIVGFVITFLVMIAMFAAVFVYIQLPMKAVKKVKTETYRPSEVFIVYLQDTTGTSEFDDTVVKRYVDNMGIVHETRKTPYGKETW